MIPDDIPSDLDREIWSNPQRKLARGLTIPSDFQYHGLRSHILLSACGAKEIAREDQGMGVFTAALLKLLSEISTHNVTYARLLQLLPSLPE